MQRLTYTNPKGERAVFDLTAPYIFWKVTGLELPPVEPRMTQATGQHGYTLHSILLDSRVITLTGHIHGKKNNESDTEAMYAARRRLNAVCNPLLGVGELLYENDSGRWKIAAFCRGNPYADKKHYIQTLDVSFECPSPFWLSYEQSAIMLAYVEGGLKFPLRTPNRFGTLGYRVTADIKSDVPVPLEFHIDGGSLNPIITNRTTGEFIKLEKHVESYESLYINTDSEKRAVILNGIDPVSGAATRHNAYGYLSHDSRLFSLAPGVNDLRFESDDENKKVRIRIYYHERYVGV